MFATKETKKQNRGLISPTKRQNSQDTADGKKQSASLPGSTHFLQRNLGNSYMQSFVGGQQTLGQTNFQNSAARSQDEFDQMRSDSNASGQQITTALQATLDPHFAYLFGETEQEIGLQKSTSFDQSKGFVVQRQEENEIEDDELNQQEGVVIIEDEEDAVQLQPTNVESQISLQLNHHYGNADVYSADEDLGKKILQSKGKGQPLDSNIQMSLESYFQQDFSSVYLHNDARAAYFARCLNAQAFTVGDDIYFKEGNYNPTSQASVQLLVHEIAHVQQQRKGVNLEGKLPGGTLAIGGPRDVYEHEANRVAREFVRTRNQGIDAGPKIGERRSPILKSMQISPTIRPNMSMQRHDKYAQRQGGPLETAATAVGIAEAAVGAVRTVSYGNYDLTRPDRIDAIAPKSPNCNLAQLPVKDWTWTFFKFREIHPLFRYEFANIHLVATWQTNGCDVRAFHVVSPAGHRRSRLQTNTKAEIFARVSTRLVPSTVVDVRTGRTITTGRPCSDYAAELMIPYEVTIDRPWPLSNYEVDGRLYLDGTGAAKKQQTEEWT